MSKKAKTFIQDLKDLYSSLPNIIEQLESAEIDNAEAVIQLASSEYDGPVNILEMIAYNPKEHATRLNAKNVNDKYWKNAENAIRTLVSDESNEDESHFGPPFANFEDLSNRYSKLKIYDDKRLKEIFSLSGLDACHLDGFERAMNICTGAFYISDSVAAQKAFILAKKNDYDDIAKKSLELRELIGTVQMPVFSFLAGSIITKKKSADFLIHFLNIQGLLNGLEHIQSLGPDLRKSDQINWLLNDQLSGQKAKFPLFAFVHLMSSYVYNRSDVKTKHLPANKTNKRFIAECLREMGVEYSDRRVASAMEYLRDKKPNLKTSKI